MLRTLFFQIFGATTLTLTDFPRKLLTFWQSLSIYDQNVNCTHPTFYCFKNSSYMFQFVCSSLGMHVGSDRFWLKFSCCSFYGQCFTHAWGACAIVNPILPAPQIWQYLPAENQWRPETCGVGPLLGKSVAVVLQCMGLVTKIPWHPIACCMFVSVFVHCAAPSLNLNRYWRTATLPFRRTLSQRPT